VPLLFVSRDAGHKDVNASDRRYGHNDRRASAAAAQIIASRLPRARAAMLHIAAQSITATLLRAKSIPYPQEFAVRLPGNPPSGSNGSFRQRPRRPGNQPPPISLRASVVAAVISGTTSRSRSCRRKTSSSCSRCSRAARWRARTPQQGRNIRLGTQLSAGEPRSPGIERRDIEYSRAITTAHAMADR